MTEKWVSVIIPVYNAVDYLNECLESIVGQTIGFDRIEVVAVDDGSTDGSGELLDTWAAQHPNIRIIHQENSGAPGGPRNRGLEVATGEFLFFADPDDYLGTEALERMLAAARRDDSDVVLGRARGVGRSAAEGPFRHNVERGDIYSTKAVWSLTAHKMFRRSLVTDNGLRFAEGVRLGEEQIFVVPAYFAAKAISVVADYDCYYLVLREGFPHLTQQGPDPEVFYSNIRKVLEKVIENTEPGARRNSLLLRWGQVEILGKFGRNFPRWPENQQKAYVRLAGELLADFIPEEVLAPLSPLDQARGRLLRLGLLDELVALARFEQSDWADLTDVAWLPDNRRFTAALRTRLRASSRPAELEHHFVLQRVSDGYEVVVPTGRPGGDETALTFQTVVDVRRLGTEVRRPGSWKILLRLSYGERNEDFPVRFPGTRLPAGAAGRKTFVSGARPMLVWISRDPESAAELIVTNWRGLAGALKRRIRKRLTQ
ncbi:glycosyltransferase [Streptomyces sp. H10-C2]|uniref:glycosyltransferase family 2 protein n=1 Tax=unclassified Streptomyces TaxID=2593676 RepID=UPI0024BA3CA1|nr:MULTISPECIES: glycosyltransferase [unclassified Streptomyces]MDJ0345611.1 glycosyltransferase [Streptomyces sp. PH10-H1]MDJ0371378.1 glycosyltransferase [Streptomyces sp. H10-C2]